MEEERMEMTRQRWGGDVEQGEGEGSVKGEKEKDGERTEECQEVSKRL